MTDRQPVTNSKRILLLVLLAILPVACGTGTTPRSTLISSATPIPYAEPTASPTFTPTATTVPTPPPATNTPLSPTPVPPSLTLERLGQIGGASKAVAVQGSYAYLNAGPRLIILDIADPAHPAVVGQSTLLPGFESLSLVDDHAYVAAGEGGLRVLDISDPAAPTEVGFYLAPGPVWSVVVAENVAYLAAQDGLHILDISNPNAPTSIGIYDSPDAALDVTVVGNIAYIAETFSDDDRPIERGGLRVVDVSDPANSAEIGFYPMNPSQVDEFERPSAPRGVQAVAVAGDYAYLTYRTERRGGLRVVDVSDPANPRQIGDYQDYVYYISDVAVVKDPSTGSEKIYAYIATGVNLGLLVMDVSDPTQPIVLDDEVPGWAQGIVVEANTLFVADELGGLHVADISDPAHPVEVGFYNTLGDARDVMISGDMAFVTDGLRDLWIVDLSNPAQPIPVGVYTAPGTIKDVAPVGLTVYIAAETAGLLVVDVSDPVHPIQTGAYNTQGMAHDVALAGDYAYVAAGQLVVLNVSDRGSPVAEFKSPLQIEELIIAENTAYLTNHGLHILDISNPAHPAETGFYTTPGTSRDLAVMGDYTFLLVKGALHIVDVSDLAHPLELSRLGFYDMPEYEGHLAVAGDYAYVAGEKSVHIVDISEPAAPRKTLSYDVPGRINGIASAGGFLYVAAGADGLITLKLSNHH